MERWVVVGGSGFSPFGFIGLCRKSKKESSKLLFWLITVEREREERGERREAEMVMEMKKTKNCNLLKWGQ